jgi:hypothetical protein
LVDPFSTLSVAPSGSDGYICKRTTDRISFNRLYRHRLWPITSGQNPSAVAQHDQPAWILGNAASIDRSGNGQVVVPVNDLFLAGAFAALIK